jgi:hypothetical protein
MRMIKHRTSNEIGIAGGGSIRSRHCGGCCCNTTLLIGSSWFETLRKLTRERCECDTHWFVRVESVREALVGTRKKWLLDMEKDGKCEREREFGKLKHGLSAD